MKNVKFRLHHWLYGLAFIFVMIALVYSFMDSEGVKAATSPSKFFYVAAVVIAIVGMFVQSGGKERELGLGFDASIQEPELRSGGRLAVTRLDAPPPSSVSNVTPIRRGGIDWGDFERQVREARALLAPRVQYDPFAVSAELTGEVPEFHPTGKTSRVNIGERYPILQGLIR